MTEEKRGCCLCHDDNCTPLLQDGDTDRWRGLKHLPNIGQDRRVRR